MFLFLQMTSGLAAPATPKHSAPHESKVSQAMLETTLVTTTVKFGSQPPLNIIKQEVVSPPPSSSVNSMTHGHLSPTPIGNLLHWDCDQYPDSASKFSPIKLEPSDPLENMGLNQNSSSDFAELKPMPFDYGNTTLTGLDPVLANSSNNNNNSKTMVNMNNSNGSTNHNHNSNNNNNSNNTNHPTATSESMNSLHNHNTGSSTTLAGTIIRNTPTSSSSSSSLHYPTSSSADVTSTATSSPPGITKLETLDFTASQDAFDDLASIVGISMGADSTVPNMESDLDLDAWIESTAQNIRPLVPDGGLDSILPMSRHGVSNHTTLTVSSQSFLQMSQSSPSSTLQSLLQGNLTPHPPLGSTKVTQLQHREDHNPGNAPPPYSILQTRLQHGSLSVPMQTHNTHNNIVKVDSTFDLMKLTDNGGGGGNGGHPYLTSNFSDSLPHSTQTLLNHVSTSADQSLHRRLGELSGLAKIKAKQNKIRQKLGLNSVSGGVASGSANGVGSPNGDQSKKMMHHCQICNRGFLNKSNIKVHLRTHTGEKPFKCEHCSKAFRQKAHLLKHMSIHKRISRD